MSGFGFTHLLPNPSNAKTVNAFVKDLNALCAIIEKINTGSVNITPA
jgi:hypothetical protein